MEIKQEVKKHYTHISISFNQQNSLAVHLASQSIQGGKKSHKKSRKEEKRAGKKRRKGSRRE